LHAKTAVIDGVWSTVGSANLDWRSFLHNEEVNAVILGDEFAEKMEALFQRDLAASRRVTLEAWKTRPFIHRVKETMGRMMEYWL
jgi:cardiolipin synthase